MSHNDNDETLRCPLCGSDEYLLSDNNSMLCAGCGSFFEDVDKIAIQCASIQLLIHQRLTRIGTSHAHH